MSERDVFISYSRQDLAWIEEELLPALEDLKVTLFVDDAAWRTWRGADLATGLRPGDEMKVALQAALAGSRFVLLVQSPEYFPSQWCRWEIALAEDLARAQQLNLLYFVLRKGRGGRLDPTPEGANV